MKANTPGEVALYITTEHDKGLTGGGYFHIYAYPVLVGTERPDSIRNISDYEVVKGGWFLHDLKVSSQGNDSDGAAARLYGYDVHYHTTRVERRDAERMAKTFARLDKALDKLRATRGHASTYGEYVARIAEVLGAKRMVFSTGPNGGSAWGYDGFDHALVDLGDGRTRIEHLERQWRASLDRKAVAS